MNIAPKKRPSISFVPIIINALENQNTDPIAKTFSTKLGKPLVDQLIKNWKKMSGPERAKRYFISREWRAPQGDLSVQLAIQSRTWLAARDQMILERKKIIRSEIDKAIAGGIANYTPSLIIQKNKTLAYEVARALNSKLFGCRCETAGQGEKWPRAVGQKFGFLR